MFFGPIFDARDYLATQLRRIGDAVKGMADELEARLALPAREIPQIEAETLTNGRSRKRVEA